MSILLIVPVLLPIAAGLYILKAGFQTRKARERFVAVTVIINASIVLLLSVFARQTQITLLELVPGNPVLFQLDTLGAMFASLVSLLWILCIQWLRKLRE